jgi:hypothetical protein
MLTEALIGLAAAGGTTVVQAVATDAWGAVKAGFARLLGRGDSSKEEMLGQQLERTRSELQAAGERPEQVRLTHQAAWQARLEDLLASHPDAADQVRALVEQVNAITGGSTGRVDQRVVGFDQAQQAVLGHGTQVVTFGSPAPPQSSR